MHRYNSMHVVRTPDHKMQKLETVESSAPLSPHRVFATLGQVKSLARENEIGGLSLADKVWKLCISLDSSESIVDQIGTSKIHST